MNKSIKIIAGTLFAYCLLKQKNNQISSIAGTLPNLRGEWIDVYQRKPSPNKRGKLNLLKYRGESGIYFIKENNKLIYVGRSGSNLYDTIRRHFTSWTDSEGRISYSNSLSKNDYTVKVHLMSPNEALEVECQLVRKYNPRDNKYKFEKECPAREEAANDDFQFE